MHGVLARSGSGLILRCRKCCRFILIFFFSFVGSLLPLWSRVACGSFLLAIRLSLSPQLLEVLIFRVTRFSRGHPGMKKVKVNVPKHEIEIIGPKMDPFDRDTEQQ